MQWILNGKTGYYDGDPKKHDRLAKIGKTLYLDRFEILRYSNDGHQPMMDRPKNIKKLQRKSEYLNDGPNFMKPVSTSVQIPGDTEVSNQKVTLGNKTGKNVKQQ